MNSFRGEPTNRQALEEIFGVDRNISMPWGLMEPFMRFDGSAWSPMQSGTANYLYSIWGKASNDLFAVGVDGTILHFDGNAWTTMASGYDLTLRKYTGTPVTMSMPSVKRVLSCITTAMTGHICQAQSPMD